MDNQKKKNIDIIPLTREKRKGVVYYCVGGTSECGAIVDHYLGLCPKHSAVLIKNKYCFS